MYLISGHQRGRLLLSNKLEMGKPYTAQRRIDTIASIL